MDSTTFYVWDQQAIGSLQTLYSRTSVLTNTTTNYYLFKLTSGDWYRLSIPYLSTSTATKLEVSTDSGSTWSDSLTYTNTTSTGIDNYKNREDSSGTPTIATTDYVGEGFSRFSLPVSGNTANDCYFGWSCAAMTYVSPSDPTWLPTAGQEVWNTSSGKSVLESGFLKAVENDSVASVHFCSTSSSNRTIEHVLMGSYDGYNCTTDADPNCETLCPVAFPSVYLNVSEATFTLTHADVGKSTTIASDFSANDGYDWLQSGDIEDNDPFTVLDEITDNQGESKTEWVTNGYSTKYELENNGIRVGSTGESCEFEGSATVYPWWAQPNAYYRSGFIGPYSSLGSRQWLCEYYWTIYDDPIAGSPGNKGVSAFTPSLSSNYDGDIESDISEGRVSFVLGVVSDTDCSVTLELTMTDENLQHGSLSIVSGGNPTFETTPVRTVSSLTPTWTFTHGSNWEFPYEAREVSANYVESTTINPTGGTAGTYGPHLMYHQTNAGGFDPEVTLTVNTTETTPSDADWLPWVVTWRKAVLKSDLASGEVTVNFSGSDVYSTNLTGSRTTLDPPDYSQPAELAYNDTYLVPSGNPGAGHNCCVYRPYGYTKSTSTVTGSDWSASVTLNQFPFYEVAP